MNNIEFTFGQVAEIKR